MRMGEFLAAHTEIWGLLGFLGAGIYIYWIAPESEWRIAISAIGGLLGAILFFLIGNWS